MLRSSRTISHVRAPHRSIQKRFTSLAEAIVLADAADAAPRTSFRTRTNMSRGELSDFENLVVLGASGRSTSAGWGTMAVKSRTTRVKHFTSTTPEPCVPQPAASVCLRQRWLRRFL
jgi:hypothetical protein